MNTNPNLVPMDEAQPTVTYRKTQSGEWVAYGPAEFFASRDNADFGREIFVTTKAGERKHETFTRIGRPFTVNGVEMAYAHLAPKSAPRRARSQRRTWVSASDRALAQEMDY